MSTITASSSANKSTHATPHYQLVVMGGGPSGVMAATMAARMGVKTLLIERGGFLGGTLTMMGVSPMMSFHNPAGDQVVWGLADELVERLKSVGASPGHIVDSITYCSTVTPFDAEALKRVLEEMVVEAGADILYHTMLADVTLSGDRLTGLVVCNKWGLNTITADQYVDATGDGDVATRAGVPFAQGREGDNATQPMTMNLKIGGVDIDRIKQDVQQNPGNYEFDLGPEEGLKRALSTDRLSLKAFGKQWMDYRDRHQVTIPRKYILFFETHERGTVVVNSSRLQGYDGTNPWDVTRAEIEGRKQCYQIFQFLKSEAIGFENSVMLSTPYHVGIRDTRRIQGVYTLTGDDVINQVKYDDTIAQGAYPIDVHSPDAEATESIHLSPHHTYYIPLRTMYSEQCSNLVIAGRCISADHNAFSAIRVTPIAMSIGQAAGAAAAVAVQDGSTISAVNVGKVQRALQAQDARLNLN
ncbi:MAG: FAD-dependent oxidoreductase [Natronospirillum sp.]